MSLADDMLSDLSTMLDTDEHAVAGVYSPKKFAGIHGLTGSVKSTTINGIFGMEFIVINDVESYSPVFDCATSDVPGATHGAKITINSELYTVRGHQPDGTGMTRLILEKV